ncbi:unnamed protein product [Didymodactylos carnosus]|uniref:Uncharacterized protein n=1 Tax=Didymodactylos carnosus TaxID=1234261 RepID=A0A814UHQ0_9BILA|nr:unnamed protein product [Didymodactylos carnosus]CAF3938747.1 unnamed protein product [Didymodactylos carnosus]
MLSEYSSKSAQAPFHTFPLVSVVQQQEAWAGLQNLNKETILYVVLELEPLVPGCCDEAETNDNSSDGSGASEVIVASAKGLLTLLLELLVTES